MSVVLKELKLHNFRNHSSFLLEEPQKFIIIIGENATGKTNIIEAIQLISMLESFRNPVWKNLVTNGEEEAEIHACFIQNERHIEISLVLQEDKRLYFLNGKKKAKDELKGIIPAVIFVPDDLMLVKDSPNVRRKLLDDIGQQLSSTYRTILNDYQKTVRQRNVVLKEYKDQSFLPSTLTSWNENLLTLGSLLSIHRIRLYKKLMEKATQLYGCFTKGEQLTSTYIPSFHQFTTGHSDDELFTLNKEQTKELLSQTLEQVQREEWARSKTLVGPHRDEIVFSLNGYEARHYGSQGQQRSIALSLKLAQLMVVQEISGNQPLLLLDDVMSELDTDRRTALIEVIEGQGIQTIITATDLNYFNEELLHNTQIINLFPSTSLVDTSSRKHQGDETDAKKS
jgi:DNA replication and repair protein RecF